MSVVVITGGSAGVGRATAQALARKRARIGLIARGEDGLNAAAKEIQQLGGTALAISADVSNNDQVRDAAQSIQRHLGAIDVWINNAMVSVFSPFQEMTAEEFRRVTEVTYLGVVYGTMAALDAMKDRSGVIVQVGSALAYRAIPLQSAYCGAKHAIEGFTESLRCELIHNRSPVKITMVHLPALNTPQFKWVKSKLHGKPQPVPPIYQPEIAADAILWAIEHAPRELIVGLPTLIALWGNRFFPKFGDWYLSKTAYESQQMKIPDDPRRPNNLWKPVPGDPGSHGEFDARSHDFSLQLWLRTHLKPVAMIGAASCAAMWFHARKKKA
jgi:NAD(P)-dependent dehydrogenase (short-subunit alcohol dehydrogenase family)